MVARSRDFVLSRASMVCAGTSPASSQANAKAASLSKPEQLFIGAMLASYQNDFAKAEDLWKQAAEAIPTDWRVQMGRGSRLFLAEKYSEAIDTLNKATAINQDAGPAYNLIGYRSEERRVGKECRSRWSPYH